MVKQIFTLQSLVFSQTLTQTCAPALELMMYVQIKNKITETFLDLDILSNILRDS